MVRSKNKDQFFALGGKIEKGESARNALKREVLEELDVNVESAQHLMNITQYYTEFRANLHVWSCDTDKSPIQDSTHKWVSKKDLNNYPMPSGSARIVDRLGQNLNT